MSSLAEKHHEKIDDDDATSTRAVKAAKLATAPVCIMDGGMGHQLRRLGVEISGPIGSVERFLGVALANLEQEDLVRAAHDAYIEAGARVIITNSYATVPGIVGEDREKVELCVRRAGEIARVRGARRRRRARRGLDPTASRQLPSRRCAARRRARRGIRQDRPGDFALRRRLVLRNDVVRSGGEGRCGRGGGRRQTGLGVVDARRGDGPARAQVGRVAQGAERRARARARAAALR